jgi:hypothetical protein
MVKNNNCFKKIFFFSFMCIEGRGEIIFPQIIPCDEFKRMKTVTQPLTEKGAEGGVVISSHTVPGFEQKLIKPHFFTRNSLAVFNVCKKKSSYFNILLKLCSILTHKGNLEKRSIFGFLSFCSFTHSFHSSHHRDPYEVSIHS